MYAFMLAAGVVAIYFLGATVMRPRPAEILALVLWSAYAVYEYYVANGTLCSENCNIRVDLVLFFPLLGWAAYLALQNDPRPLAVTILYVVCLGLSAWVASLVGYTAVAIAAAASAVVAALIGIRATRQRRQA